MVLAPDYRLCRRRPTAIALSASPGTTPSRHRSRRSRYRRRYRHDASGCRRVEGQRDDVSARLDLGLAA